MGNTSGGHKRRSSLEEEFSSGKRLLFQDSQDFPGDDSVISIVTEGMTINAIADQLRDSRICGRSDKAMIYVGGSGSGQDGTEDSLPQSVPTVFRWEGAGKDVYISGTFNGWKSKIPMVRSSSKQNFYTIVDLPVGEHQYKFIVDGQWRLDQNQPVATSLTGVQNNVIQVKESDIDVLTALSYDMASSRGGAGNDDHSPGTPLGTPIRTETYHQEAFDSADPSFHMGSGSPPGEYSRVIPACPSDVMTQSSAGSIPSPQSSSDAKKAQTPPMLPPQLLQVVLLQCNAV